MQHTPHIGFPFPLTIGATLAVVWALSGDLVPLLLHLPTCSALQGEGKKRESASGQDLPPGVHHLHLLGGEGMKCPSPAFLWWKWEWTMHPSFSLGEDMPTM